MIAKEERDEARALHAAVGILLVAGSAVSSWLLMKLPGSTMTSVYVAVAMFLLAGSAASSWLTKKLQEAVRAHEREMCARIASAHGSETIASHIRKRGCKCACNRGTP